MIASDVRLGSQVIYVSRTGKYECAAVVTATTASLALENVERGLIPGLSSNAHVHLTVFSAGKPGHRAEAADFLAESQHGRMENVGGCYQEWEIAYDPECGPGTWHWPALA
jgi:hypothetical protein